MKLINQNGSAQIVVGFGVLSILLIVAAFVLPWNRINWGKIQYTQTEVVSVTGEANSKQKNQIASFTAGVNIIKDNKEEAVAEVNKKTSDLIESVKQFGIPAADIKTQNMSVYQQQDAYRTDVNNKWSVNNSVEIILRDVDKASALADVLNKSGANNVYGPNFRFDDTKNIENTLFDEAMKNAREKAELIAKASGRSLGKVISVSEGSSGSSIYPMMDKAMGLGGGGAPVEPGTGTVSKSLNVVFELK